MTSTPRTYGRQRARFLCALVIVGFLAFSVRLVWLQVIRSHDLAQAAENARVTTLSVPAKRGDIVDRSGTVLATSIQTYDVYAAREYIEGFVRTKKGDDGENVVVGRGIAQAARELAPLLDKPAAEIGGQLLGGKGSTILRTNVSVENWRRIAKLAIPGIDGVPSYERAYPNGATASSVLGFTALAGDGAPGSPLEGKAGIERTQDDLLKGRDGKRSVEISPLGQEIPGGYSKITPAVDGATVRSTLSADLQSLAQHAIDAAVDKHGAEWGSVVVEDVRTGAILALADSDSADPNDVREGKVKMLGSRAVQYTYEPGSTGKLVTFATGLQKKTFTPLTPVNVPYEITMKNNQKFKDSHEHGVLKLTAAGVLAESSNTGTVQLGDRMSDNDRWDMMKALGLGEKTGIEMPGEADGIIGDPATWDGRQRYTTMFGQGMTASPLQVASMVATIANSGVRVPVHIVDAYKSANGVWTKPEREAPKQVMDPDVAQTLLKMMEAVTTDEGTARAADVPGYHTAGKTGTTEILGARGSDKGVVSSFVGVLPAEDPAVAIAVVVYKPTVGPVWGGTVAGPVFSKVGAAAMAQLGVAPSTAERTLYPQKVG